MKEANLDTIELFEDDPRAVRALIRYIYTREYRDKMDRNTVRDNMTSDLEFYMNVYAAALKYGFKELEQSVQADFYYHLDDYNTVTIQTVLTATSLMNDVFPNPPAELANTLNHRLTTDIQSALSTPKTRAELMKIVS